MSTESARTRPFIIGWGVITAAATGALAYVGAWMAAGRPEISDIADADHAALDMAIGISAVLAAVVVGARMSQQIRWDDLLLTAAFSVMAAASLVWRVVFPAWGEAEFTHAGFARLIGVALVLVAACVSHARRVPRLTHTRGAVGGAVAIVIGLIIAAALAIDSSAQGHESARFIAWISLGATVAGVVLSVRKQRITGDPLWGWLAAALVFFSAARLQVGLSGNGHPEYLGGDLLPLLAYGCVVLGVIAEARTYWRARARDAAAGEARRMAERVHEGLLQEIVYARRSARDGMPDPLARARTEDALIRAEQRARELMHAVIEQSPPDFSTALENAVMEAGERLGIEVRAAIAQNLTPQTEAARVLIYAATEAVANAARHSGASAVAVHAFARGRHVVLHVRDPGRGSFGSSAAQGFGLPSVRDAVRSCGGTLRTASAPSRGTTLVVEV